MADPRWTVTPTAVPLCYHPSSAAGGPIATTASFWSDYLDQRILSIHACKAFL